MVYHNTPGLVKMNFLTVCVLISLVGFPVIRAQCPKDLKNDKSITGKLNKAGDAVTYKCKSKDDRIVGTENVRKAVVKCKDGKLKDARPCCEKKKCPPLPAGVNTEAVPSDFERIIGEQYTYKCLPGYSTLATKILTCQNDLSYNPPSAPTCTINKCGLPPNGTNTVPINPLLDLEFMDGFSYQCITGYTTNDPTVAVCLKDGAFSISPPNCNIPVTPCAPNPCQNGGTCSSCIGGYSCQCARGFMGDNCEMRAPDCSTPSVTCQNGGTCVITGGIGLCNCAPGWTGGICTTNIDECALNPCQNGGTCVDGINSFTCICPSSRTGSLCQDRFCPSDWRLSPAGNCYYFTSLADRRYWESANNSCPMGGRLIILQDSVKLADLSNTAAAGGSGVAPNVDYWIGGGQLTVGLTLDSSALFRWIDTTLVDGSIITTPGSVTTSSEKEMLFYRFRVNLPDQIFYDNFIRTKPYICEMV